MYDPISYTSGIVFIFDTPTKRTVWKDRLASQKWSVLISLHIKNCFYIFCCQQQFHYPTFIQVYNMHQDALTFVSRSHVCWCVLYTIHTIVQITKNNQKCFCKDYNVSSMPMFVCMWCITVYSQRRLHININNLLR